MRPPLALAILALLATSTTVVAQQVSAGQPYSKSTEYQRMIDEIHSPAPSPAYIATGARPQADPALAVDVKEDVHALRLTTRSATYTLDKSTLALTVDNLLTHQSWTLSLGLTAPLAAIQRDHNRWSIASGTDAAARSLQLEILTSGLARLTLSDGPGPQLHIDGGGPFFGLGERFVQSSLSGTSLDVRPQDRFGEPGHNWTYVAVPFLYGPSGLGLYADTAFDTHFRINDSDSSHSQIDLQIASAPVSLYLFAEPSPKAILTAYTAITGRPQNPPLWTFGPWITTLGGNGAVLNYAQRIRNEAIPASALWIYDQQDEPDNLGWPFWFFSYYGDPRAFNDILHGQGFRVLTYVHPYLRSQTMPYMLPNPTWQKAVKDHLLMTDTNGQPYGPHFEQVQTGNVDFTNPAAVDMWQTMITHAVFNQGFDGWMEDFGEWVRDTDHFAAGTGRTLSELYPLLYHKVTNRIALSLNPAVVPFARSGSPGSQQFGALWGADQQANWSRDWGLPSVVTAGITAGMSGYSTWGPDILSTGSNADLWARWVEFGALTPVMRDHVWDKPEHSINLWSNADTTAHFRRWAAFHSSLLPYFATYAAEAARTGIPIMRHTVLEYPDDPRAATAEYQYFLGRELLVAPIVQPGGQRTLYLPKGEWTSFWGGEYYNGGHDITISTDQIVVLVKAGSILPFKPESEAAHWDWNDPQILSSSLVWKAFLSETGSADGSFTMPNGTSAHLQQNGDEVAVDGKSSTTRDYEVIVRSKQPPASVRLNGAVFPPYTKASSDKPVSQWWWNPSTFEVYMLFHAADFKLNLSGVVTVAYAH
jgi:alpha-glucosidase (family GH31 glycosyl hydrolase)